MNDSIDPAVDRRFPVVEFDSSKFSDFFGQESNRLTAQLLTGGACNSNYRVETDRGKFVCRIYNRGNPQVERAIVDLVADWIPTPEYLWVGDGVAVMRLIEGQHFEPTKNLVREAGRLIGRLAKVNLSRAGELKPNGSVVAFNGWRSFEEGLSAFLIHPAVIRYLQERTIVRLRGLIDRQSELLASFDRSQNLVHGDFRPDNILVVGDSITGVLDWEFAHSGCSYMDIGNLMRHISPEWGPDFEMGLVEEGFEMPDDWMFRAALIDLSSHLEFLTSNRSDAFKKSCVDRIQRLIRLEAESNPCRNG